MFHVEHHEFASRASMFHVEHHELASRVSMFHVEHRGPRSCSQEPVQQDVPRGTRSPEGRSGASRHPATQDFPDATRSHRPCGERGTEGHRIGARPGSVHRTGPMRLSGSKSGNTIAHLPKWNVACPCGEPVSKPGQRRCSTWNILWKTVSSASVRAPVGRRYARAPPDRSIRAGSSLCSPSRSSTERGPRAPRAAEPPSRSPRAPP